MLYRPVNHFWTLYVLVLPESPPRISGGKARYNVGDKAKLNCTSAKSKPATSLSWYINGEPVNITHVYFTGFIVFRYTILLLGSAERARYRTGRIGSARKFPTFPMISSLHPITDDPEYDVTTR